MSDTHNDRPYYDRRAKCWKVDFPDRASESGDLLYVAGEYAMTSLCYPYNTSQTRGTEYSGHSHSFEGAIRSLLGDPAGFSIDGFESYYSEQEREMLERIRSKLLQDITPFDKT